MSFCSVEALIQSVHSASSLEKDPSIRLISLFDHEEIGSTSAQGAESNLLPSLLHRLSVLPGTEGSKVDATAYERSLSSSFLISADMGKVSNMYNLNRGNHWQLIR